MKYIINCHTHIFTLNHVPCRFIPGQRLIASTSLSRYKIAAFLRNIIPWCDSDLFDRLGAFIENGNFGTQQQVFERLSVFYPSDTRFAVHSMDFEYMGAGKTTLDYFHQLDELAEIKKKYPDKVYPFIGIDPRRPDVFDVFRKYIEEHDFTGVKLYPAMGFFPFDTRLYPVFEYAQRYQIPIMTHCSSSGPVYGRIIPPSDLRTHPKSGNQMVFKNNKTFADYYSDPDNYLYMLEDFPLLKICFAHFGGDRQCLKYYRSNNPEEITDNWFVKIHDLLKKYRNTYADISYSSAQFDLLALFNALLQNPLEDRIPDIETKINGNYIPRNKILFGSDFYMSNIERNERWFSMNVRMGLGEEHYQLIAHENAKRFLTHHGV